jgi:hypothetical protein
MRRRWATPRAPAVASACDHHRIGPLRQRLEDVAAATDTAVNQPLRRWPDRLTQGRQQFGGGWRAIKGAASVVGNDDAASTDVDRATRVTRVEDALENHRQTRLADQPGDVVPGRHLRHQGGEDTARSRRVARGWRRRAQVHRAQFRRRHETGALFAIARACNRRIDGYQQRGCVIVAKQAQPRVAATQVVKHLRQQADGAPGGEVVAYAFLVRGSACK